MRILSHSYIFRLFCLLFALLLLLMIVAGVLIYSYASQTVGEEFLRLNSAYLNEIASSLGNTLTEVRSLGQQLSLDNNLLTLLEGPGDNNAATQASSLLSVRLMEYISTHQGPVKFIDGTVLGRNGLCASVYNPADVTYDELLALSECSALLDTQTQVLMLPTAYRDNGSGIMTYTFQLLFPIRTLFGNELEGILMLEVSELFLFKQYRAYLSDDADLAVLTSEGVYVSHQDKTKIGTVLPYPLAALQAAEKEKTIRNNIIDGSFLISKRIPGTDWLLYEKLSASTAFATLWQVRNVMVFVLLGCIGISLIAMLLTARKLLSRVQAIETGLEHVSHGKLETRLQIRGADEFGHIEASFNDMAEQLQRLIEKIRCSEQQKRAAEMDFLHAQINSHFIHNTLTSIRFMLETGKTQDAGEMLFYFSKLLRQTLSRSSEFIPLHEELAALRSYVNIQKYRYPGTFSVEYDIAPEVENANVLSMILQPVVENAIFHASAGTRVHIRITASREDDTLVIAVKDDGVGMSEEQQYTILHKEMPLNHVGLRNVHERIHMCYGAHYGIHIAGALREGTVITFTLPFSSSQEEQP